MSGFGITVTMLATQLSEAVLKDEAPECGGFDLSAGLFGPNVSTWIRLVAEEIDTLRAELDAMKKQAPAYYGPRAAIENGATTFIASKCRVNPTDTALYLAPGAQGEQK